MSKKKKEHSPFLKRIITLAALLVVGVFFPLFAASNPDVIERFFSRGLYVPISSALGAINSLMPFSFTEIALIALAAILLLLILLAIVRLIKRRASVKGFFSGVLTLALTAAILLNVFYFSWGLNYYRTPLSKLMGFNMTQHSFRELYELCVSLRDEANALRPTLSEDENGVFALDTNVNSVFTTIAQEYETVGETYEYLSRHVYPAKSVGMSDFMSAAGISGIFMPFFAEANVNTHQPPLLIPFSAAHENAHYLGFAREDEANFIAYLVCSGSIYPQIRYSGVVAALMYSANALNEADPALYGELLTGFSTDLKADFSQFNAYWAGFEGEVMDTVNDINDGYLKFNEQESGIKSYGEMVDLLLEFYN